MFNSTWNVYVDYVLTLSLIEDMKIFAHLGMFISQLCSSNSPVVKVHSKHTYIQYSHTWIKQKLKCTQIQLNYSIAYSSFAISTGAVVKHCWELYTLLLSLSLAKLHHLYIVCTSIAQVFVINFIDKYLTNFLK